MTKVTVTYTGPGSVVLAGRHLLSGESRMVESEQLQNILLTHPRMSFLVNGERIPGPEPEAEPANPPAISDPIEVVDDMTVDQIKAIASETTDIRFVEDLIEQEKSGKARKGALEALEARLAELTADPGEEAEA